MMNNKKGKIVLAFSLLVFSLMLITSSYSAQDFIIENKTSALFVVNGTTGNIFMVPSFGKVGIGTVSPGVSLTVIGNASISGNLSVGGNLSVDGSTFFVDATSNNVGIGTTNPTNKLQVDESGASAVRFRIGNSLGAGQIYTDASGNPHFYAETADKDLIFEVNGVSNAMTIKSTSGNVGIGTTTPTNKLSVIGTINATIVNATALLQDGNPVLLSKDFNLGNVSNDTLKISQNSTISLWNASGSNIYPRELSGMVGIGTNNPVRPLTVNGTAIFYPGNANISFNNPSGGVAQIIGTGDFALRADGGNLNLDATGGIIQVAPTTEASSYTAAAVVVPGGVGISKQLLVQGNIGIGTTAPTNKLSVIGTINATIVNATTFYTANGTVAGPSITFFQDENTGIAKTNEDNLTLVTGGASRLTIDSSGNVGIGTTTPLSTLNIVGKLGFNLTSGGYSINDAIINIKSDAAVTTELLDFGNNARGGGLRGYEDGSGSVRLSMTTRTTSGTQSERLTLIQTGNVGIGTTEPNKKLEVNVTTASDGISTNGTLYTSIINTTDANRNMTISSGGGSVIIRLG